MRYQIKFYINCDLYVLKINYIYILYFYCSNQTILLFVQYFTDLLDIEIADKHKRIQK